MAVYLDNPRDIHGSASSLVLQCIVSYSEGSARGHLETNLTTSKKRALTVRYQSNMLVTSPP